MQESFLCQKSRVQWLKDSDSNTKYFHTIVNWRKKCNSIKGVEVDGNDAKIL